MANFVYRPQAAIDQTGELVTRGTGQVFAITDTSFTTPLTVSGSAGLAGTVVDVSGIGQTTEFSLEGHPEVWWRSGEFVCHLFSVTGMLDATDASAAAASLSAQASEQSAAAARAAAALATAPAAEVLTAILTNPASPVSLLLGSIATTNVAERVPLAVTTALSSEPLIAQAVAGAATEAVEDAIEAADLVFGSDERLPQWWTTASHLMVLLDAVGHETWLGVNAENGGPTPWALRHLERSLGVSAQPAPGYLMALTDDQNRMTDLAIRSSDGQLPDWVIDRLRPRILAGYQPPTPPAPPKPPAYADTRYVDGAEIRPLATDSTRAAGFGSSSMAGIDSRFSTLFAANGISYYSGGKGSERSEHIAARLGSIPAVLTVVGGEIPASGSVAVTTTTMVLTSALRPYPGVLAGVPGTLAYDAATAGYRFTRTTTGSATPVAAPTPFTPDAASYRDAIVLLWMGKNNMGMANADTLVIEQTDATVDWLTPLARRVLVLGHFVDLNTAVGSLEYTQIRATNAAHAKRYGKLFVDVAGYLSSAQVWTDTGITPTADDLAKQAQGIKPASLSENDGHLNAAGYDAVTNFLIAPRLRELDWLRTNRRTSTAPDGSVNSIVGDGVYRVSAAQGVVANGYPTASPGVLDVSVDSAGSVTQSFITTRDTMPMSFRRHRSSGGTWYAWQEWQASRFASPGGRAQYTWDRSNSRDQLTYYDSGWRDISALLGEGYTGQLKIRRTGHVVYLAGNVACATGLTTVNGILLAAVPAGFEGAASPWPDYPVHVVGSSTWFALQRQANVLVITGAPAVTDTSRVRFEVSWSTVSAVTNTPPGLADGIIPYA